MNRHIEYSWNTYLVFRCYVLHLTNIFDLLQTPVSNVKERDRNSLTNSHVIAISGFHTLMVFCVLRITSIVNDGLCLSDAST